MNHDDIDGDNYKGRKDVWLPYIKLMEEITGFSRKDCLSLPGLGWKYFNSLRTEEDEPIYTYNVKYIRKYL